MIAVDAAVWIDHLSRPDRALVVAMENGLVVMHPMILGELACGMMSERVERFRQWLTLPRLDAYPHLDVVDWIESERLMGLGIGFIDFHLLYSTLQMPGTRLWTRDKRLHRLAAEYGVAHPASS